MLVPPSSTAASAASLTSQLAAKDPSSPAAERAQAARNPTSDIHVDRSGASDPDRDAQGQGDGLGERRQHPQSAEPEGSALGEFLPDSFDHSAHLPNEPPSKLDIVG